MRKDLLAIEFTSKDILPVIAAFDPTIAQLDYEKFLHLNFLVLNQEGPGTWALVSPKDISRYADHIEPETLKMKFVRLIQED